MNQARSWLNGLGRRADSAVVTVPDLNLIPPEVQGRRLDPAETRFALFILLELALAVLLFQIVGEQALAAYRGFLGSDADAVQVSSLQAQVDRTNGQLQEARLDIQAVNTRWIPWGGLLEYLYATAPDDAELGLIRQTNAIVTFSGTAASTSSITSYRQSLLASPAISTVDLSAVSRDQNADRFNFTFALTIEVGEPVARE